MSHLLLISNSTQHGRKYLDHCAEAIESFLAGTSSVLFVPYALHDHDGYAEKVAERFASMGKMVYSIHSLAEPAAAVADASAIFVGGGNTFRLLAALHGFDLIRAIRARVASGGRYMGSSAGSVIAAPTLKTTNDMPIVEPPSFEALGLIPFQINAHYLDPDLSSTHMGETRETRIQEFHEVNETPVVGLREGSWILVDGAHATLGGTNRARVFRRGKEPVEVEAGSTLDLVMPYGA